MISRRDLLMFSAAAAASVATANAIVEASAKPIVRLPVDSDLAQSSFRWAAELAGWVDPPGVYRLRVSPQLAPWAEQVLRAEFAGEWRAHLVIDNSIQDVDEWYLEGAHSVVHSLGA